MEHYVLILLHKLEESFGLYDVQTGIQLANVKTRPFPHEVCLDPSRNKIFIAEMGVRGIDSEGTGGHTISIFDIKTQQQIGSIDTGKFDRPHGIVANGNKLFITSESTKHLLIYDLVKERLLKAVFLNQECAHMVNISPDGKVAYTANIYSNTISAVDLENYQLLDHIPVLERPEGMVFSKDGNIIFCVCREARAVAVIDRKLNKMTTKIETGDGPVRIAITPDGNKLCIPLFHSAAVQFVDIDSGKVIHTLKVGPHPAGVCLSPDGKVAFISCEEENIVYMIDLKTYEILNKISTGNGADAMVCLFSHEMN